MYYYFIPIVLYATEAVYPDKTSLKHLDKLVDTAVHKIFKTFDEQITFDITEFVGLRNLKEKIDERRSKFRRKIKSHSNSASIDYLTNFKYMYYCSFYVSALTM